MQPELASLSPICVAGAGTMGTGIVQLLLRCGFAVNWLVRPVQTAPATVHLRDFFRRGIERGRYETDDVQHWLSTNLRITADAPQALPEAHLLIEAITESRASKALFFYSVDSGLLRPDTVVLTNTSSLRIAEMAGWLSRPERFMGMHFFNPPAAVRLAELIRGPQTSDATYRCCAAFAQSLHRIAVNARDVTGFIGNRGYAPYLAAARAFVEDGATVEEVNAALRGFGMAMGPLEVDDLVGLDVACKIADRLGYPSGALTALVQSGCYGRKTGEGWSLYPPGSKEPKPNPRLEFPTGMLRAITGQKRQSFTSDEIVARCLRALVSACHKLVADRIADSPEDVDTVFREGYGFPRAWRGPLHWWESSHGSVTSPVLDASLTPTVG